MNACGQRRGMCSPNFPSCNKLKKIRRNFRRISASLWLASTYGKMIVEKDAKAAAWLLGKLQALRYTIQDWIYG